ncbi:MAG: hypothetical protein HDR97_00600 [Bacteroides sp.]|nr:hypothetical protein [Bacteroides sp.]
MSIYVSGDIIYAIKRTSNGKLELVTFPLTLECEPTDHDLRQHFNYSGSLSDQYASDIPYEPLNTPYSRNLFNATRHLRRTALAFQKTSDRVMSENDIVAISHRRGGWKIFTWNYNEDISFEVYSNFGYGSCSELLTRFFYKGFKLTPYSHYVKYRFANFSQLIHSTYNYRLEYSEWRRLMTDTLVFYNAVCDNQENEVFRWVRSHLNQMMDGLNKLLTQSSYYFQRPNGSSECVSGDELEEIKAEKIGGAVEFVDNIKNLPYQINPQEYINTLFSILDRYYLHAIEKEKALKEYITNLEQQVARLSKQPVLSIYDRLHKRHYYKDNWHLNSKKIEMLRYLLHLHQRLNKPFSKTEITDGIKQIPCLLEERDKVRSELFGKKRLLESIQEAIQKINQFKEGQHIL